MRRADRLFQIVQFLRNRRFCTAADLAEELEVSTRTIYRDIQDLQRSGVPVVGEAGVGYQLSRGYELPALTFNAEEIEALAMGLRVAEAWGDTELAAASRAALRKIENVLPETLRRALLDTRIYAPRGPRAEAMTAGALADLRRAVSEERKVFMTYVRADGRESQRTIRPLGLHFWGTTWSLAAWCELRADYRTFRPDRVVELKVLSERFDCDDGVDLQAYLQAMREQHSGGGDKPMITGAGSRD